MQQTGANSGVHILLARLCQSCLVGNFSISSVKIKATSWRFSAQVQITAVMISGSSLYSFLFFLLSKSLSSPINTSIHHPSIQQSFSFWLSEVLNTFFSAFKVRLCNIWEKKWHSLVLTNQKVELFSSELHSCLVKYHKGFCCCSLSWPGMTGS